MVLEYNHRAIACYKKCGFVQECVLRETAFVDGVWHDDILMSILEDEYRAISSRWKLPHLEHSELIDG